MVMADPASGGITFWGDAKKQIKKTHLLIPNAGSLKMQKLRSELKKLRSTAEQPHFPSFYLA